MAIASYILILIGLPLAIFLPWTMEVVFLVLSMIAIFTHNSRFIKYATLVIVATIVAFSWRSLILDIGELWLIFTSLVSLLMLLFSILGLRQNPFSSRPQLARIVVVASILSALILVIGYYLAVFGLGDGDWKWLGPAAVKVFDHIRMMPTNEGYLQGYDNLLAAPLALCAFAAALLIEPVLPSGRLLPYRVCAILTCAILLLDLGNLAWQFSRVPSEPFNRVTSDLSGLQALEVADYAKMKHALWAEIPALKWALIKSEQGDELSEMAYISSRLVSLLPREWHYPLVLSAALDGLGYARFAQSLLGTSMFSEDELAKIIPTSPRTAWVLSSQWGERNRIDEVVSVLEPFFDPDLAFQKDGKDFGKIELARKIALRYGDFILYQGKWEPAQKIADSVLMNDPMSAPAHTLKGETAYVEGDMATAFMALQAAYSIRPLSPRIAANLAAVHMMLDNMESAALLTPRAEVHFPARLWKGEQGARMYLSGESYLQFYAIGGEYRIDMFASGTQAKEQWPEMSVWTNGQLISRNVVAHSDPQPYTFHMHLRRGPNRLSVRFENDFGDPHEDRNLFLGDVRIRPLLKPGIYRDSIGLKRPDGEK